MNGHKGRCRKGIHQGSTSSNREKNIKIKNVPQHNISHICQTYNKCFIKWETQLRTVFQNQMKAHNSASFIQLCSSLNESKTVAGNVLKGDDSKGKDR